MISPTNEIKSFTPTNKALETFDIRNFADRLTAKKGKNRYECPCCNGALTIDPKTGKYNCWGEDCKKADIREAIRPLDEALREADIEPTEFTPKPREFTPKPAIPKAATIPVGEVKLGTLPSPVSEPARVQRGGNIEIVYPYGNSQHVLRIEKLDGSKVTIPKYLDANGNLISGKGGDLWEPYRFAEIAEYGKGKWILQLEGEKCVDAARSHLQLLAFTFQGSCWGEKDLIRYFQMLKDAGITGVIYWADHDKAGYAKAKKCAAAAAKVGLPFIEISPIRLWSDCPDSGDIADWIKASLANIEALHQEIDLCAIALRGKNIVNAVAHVEKYNQWNKWLKSREFTPTILIDEPEVTNATFDISLHNAIIAIKSAMGTSKTRWLLCNIKNSSNRAFLLGCLNNLLLQTIGVAAKEFDTQIYHLHLDEAGLLVADVDTYIACCVDSMQHLDGYFKGVDLYIDEICSVIASILSGGTLGERQGYIMKVFEKAVREADRVFILDAKLSDIITDFIAKIDPTKTVVKVLNKAQPKPHHFKFVDGFNPDKNTISSRDKSPVIKAILESKKPFIASDSRKFINSIDEVLKNEGKTGGTLTRDTVSEDWAKAFLSNPNEYLESNKLDYFGISPSANSGVSITTIAGFTDKISVFTGVLATNQQSQILMRDRIVLNHLIYCPESSTIQRDKIKAKTPYSYYLETINKVALSAELTSNGNQNIAEALGVAIQKYKGDIWFDLSCELGALDNFERENLRKCLIYALEEEGHTTEIISLETSKEDAQKLADAKEALLQKQAEEQFNAEPLQDIHEANRIAKTSPKPPMMRRVDKTRLLDRLPGIDLANVWDVNFILTTLKDPDFINKHSRFWMLNNVDISLKRSELKWYFGATGEHSYLQSMVKDSHLKIWALHQLNILQFADGREYSKDSLEVIEFYNKALNDKKINMALGEKINAPTVTGKERIELLRKCLAAIGLNLKYDGKKTINGIRQRVYSLDIEAFNDAVRLEVVNAIDRKYSGYLTSDSVKKINWENHITTPKIEGNDTVLEHTESEINEKVNDGLAFIREYMGCHTLEGLSAFFNFEGMNEADRKHIKKRVWEQLTTDEKSILKSLNSHNIAA